MWSVSGQMNVEFKASGIEGATPEYGLLLESGLGSVRSITSKTTSDAEGGTYSTSVLCFSAADAAEYSVGDTIVVQKSGAYHISPISQVGTNEVTLLVPASEAFTNGLTVSAVSTYFPADLNHKPISVSRYIEDAILEKAAGCKITSVGLEGFTTGAMAKWNFGFEGLSTDRLVSANALTPTFDTALPPIILSAYLYQDGVEVPVNDVAFSIENELGFITATGSEQGKLSSRITKRTISGSFNPYKQNDSVSQWSKFKANTEYSIFGYAMVPKTTTGEYEDVIAFYMPYCITTELAEGDKDGVLQDSITFQAGGGSDQENEIYISFI